MWMNFVQDATAKIEGLLNVNRDFCKQHADDFFHGTPSFHHSSWLSVHSRFGFSDVFIITARRIHAKAAVTFRHACV